MSKIKRLWLGLALVCASAWAAVGLDVTIPAGFASSAATVSAPDVTVGSGADRYAYAALASRDFSASTTHDSATLESVGLTKLGTEQSWFFGLGEISAWRLIAPGSGANRTLTGNVGAAQNDLSVFGIVYTGVDQTTPERDIDQTETSGTASSVTPSLTLTTVAGDRVTMACILQLETPDTIVVSGETERVKSVSSDLTSVIVDEVAAGTSTTISPTLTFDGGSNNYRVACHAVAIIPAAEAGGGAPKQMTTLGAG